MKKLILILAFLVVPILAFGETFCVQAGDTWNGSACVSDCESEISANTCMDGDDLDYSQNPSNWGVGSNVVGAGDTVIFTDDGGIIDLASDIDSGAAGSEGSPITFIKRTGDTPTIRFVTTQTGWSLDSGYIYYKALNCADGVFEDGEPLTEVTAKGGMSAGTVWYDQSTYCYIWTTDNANPSTHTITEPGGTGIWIMDIEHDYITVDGFKFIDGFGGIRLDGADNVIIQNCAFEDFYHNAIGMANAPQDGQFLNNTFDTVGHGGIYTSTGADGHTMTGNVCSNMNYPTFSYQSDYDPPYDGHCVAIYEGDNNTVNENKCTDCRDAFALFAASTAANNNTFKYNAVFGSSALKTYYESGGGGSAYGKGLIIGSSSVDVLNGNVFMYNIVDQVNRGIRISGPSSGDWTSGYVNYFLNNTIYDCIDSVSVNGEMDYYVIKNNIITESDDYHIYEDDAYTGGHISYDENQYYSSDSPVWSYQGTDKTTFALWKAANATYNDPNSDEGDPGLTNPSSGDFTLKAELDGANLGASYDDGLDPNTTNLEASPMTISTLDQDDYLPWDRGAFVYVGASDQTHDIEGLILTKIDKE